MHMLMFCLLLYSLVSVLSINIMFSFIVFVFYYLVNLKAQRSIYISFHPDSHYYVTLQS